MLLVTDDTLAREPQSAVPTVGERASCGATAALGLSVPVATAAAGANTVSPAAFSLAWASASVRATSARPAIGCLGVPVAAVASCLPVRAGGVAGVSRLSAATFKTGEGEAPIFACIAGCHGSTPEGLALASASMSAAAVAAAEALTVAGVSHSFATAGGGGQSAAGWLAGAAGAAAASCPVRRSRGVRLCLSLSHSSDSP